MACQHPSICYLPIFLCVHGNPCSNRSRIRVYAVLHAFGVVGKFIGRVPGTSNELEVSGDLCLRPWQHVIRGYCRFLEPALSRSRSRNNGYSIGAAVSSTGPQTAETSSVVKSGWNEPTRPKSGFYNHRVPDSINIESLIIPAAGS